MLCRGAAAGVPLETPRARRGPRRAQLPLLARTAHAASCAPLRPWRRRADRCAVELQGKDSGGKKKKGKDEEETAKKGKGKDEGGKKKKGKDEEEPAKKKKGAKDDADASGKKKKGKGDDEQWGSRLLTPELAEYQVANESVDSDFSAGGRSEDDGWDLGLEW